LRLVELNIKYVEREEYAQARWFFWLALSEKTGLPSHQTDLKADLPGLGFDLHPNPSPSLNKPVGAGASPFCKLKTSLSFIHAALPRYLFPTSHGHCTAWRL
jgi:hypothetical protein